MPAISVLYFTSISSIICKKKVAKHEANRRTVSFSADFWLRWHKACIRVPQLKPKAKYLNEQRRNPRAGLLKQFASKKLLATSPKAKGAPPPLPLFRQCMVLLHLWLFIITWYCYFPRICARNGFTRFHKLLWASEGCSTYSVDLFSIRIAEDDDGRKQKSRSRDRGTSKIFRCNTRIRGECVDENNYRDPVKNKKDSEVLNCISQLWSRSWHHCCSDHTIYWHYLCDFLSK